MEPGSLSFWDSVYLCLASYPLDVASTIRSRPKITPSPKRISGSLSVVSGQLSVNFDELLLLVIELKNTTDN